MGASMRVEPAALSCGPSSASTSGPDVLISTKTCPVAAASAPLLTAKRVAHGVGARQAADDDLGTANGLGRRGDDSSDAHLLGPSSGSVPEDWLEFS
jgi:hypothetical protein